MSEEDAGGGENLTGVWHGMYTYPYGGEPTAFVASVLDTAGALSGTTHEASTLPWLLGVTVFATIGGAREGENVSFLKTYDDAAQGSGYDRPVRYEGRLNADRTEIEGRWRIAGEPEGKFLMIRERQRAKAAARTAYEKV
ncbi:hypothetical protein [Phenylobacterium sp.]|jgi:hypothetical protein|uniref:hypothetical protein n=1 Tax=Phenylobacterium sp. TaxID=1871053 RepID=UPI002F949801